MPATGGWRSTRRKFAHSQVGRRASRTLTWTPMDRRCSIAPARGNLIVLKPKSGCRCLTLERTVTPGGRRDDTDSNAHWQLATTVDPTAPRAPVPERTSLARATRSDSTARVTRPRERARHAKSLSENDALPTIDGCAPSRWLTTPADIHRRPKCSRRSRRR